MSLIWQINTTDWVEGYIKAARLKGKREGRIERERKRRLGRRRFLFE